MNIALLLSGGVGLRLGAEIPKQYMRVAGRRIITYSLQTLVNSPDIDAVCIVSEQDWREPILADAREHGICVDKIICFAEPGANRQESVFHGLQSILQWLDGEDKTGGIQKTDMLLPGNVPSNCQQQGKEEQTRKEQIKEEQVDKERIKQAQGNKEQAKDEPTKKEQTNGEQANIERTWQEQINKEQVFRHSVLIHDAARPNLTQTQIAECYAAFAGHDGVMPALPMKDTVYLSEDGSRISQLLDRSTIFAGQAPELFDLHKYYRANAALLPEGLLGINGSTEPAILAGMDMVMIPGDDRNFKITTPADLERFREMSGMDRPE